MIHSRLEEVAVEPERDFWTRKAPKYVAYIFSPEDWVYKLRKPHDLADREKSFCPDCFANEKIVLLQDGCCPCCTFQIVNLSIGS
jgi:hypothetical protein